MEERAVRHLSYNELSEILEKHKQWLQDNGKGERANLSATDLSGINLANVNLQYANLHHVNLQDAFLQGVNLKGADLSFAELGGAYLKDATLREANMEDADLSYANLSYASLHGARLTMAYLVNAKLYATDLGYANLKKADMRGADLRKTILYGAFLDGMCRPWFIYVGALGSEHSEALYFADIDKVRCSYWNDCVGGTLAEFEERVDKIYPPNCKIKINQQRRSEYLLAIKMFKGMREEYLKNGGIS